MLLPYDEQDTPDSTIAAVKEVSGNPMRDRVINELLLADLGIVGVALDNESGLNVEASVKMLHKTNSAEKAEDNTFFTLPLERESKGTQRFFARIGPWIKALEKGSILLVDEIEASLHPMLTRSLVEMIQNQNINTNHAQLIFTTHDVMLLDLTLLRRDQIWFTDKDPEAITTELFSLWDFSVHKGENIRKGYLQGRYGAIPFFGGDVKWHE
jgi:AAA15 family ATPase/GTPase